MGGNQSQPNATAIIGTGKGGPLDTSAGTIASRGISFTYDHAAEPALRDITLTVPAGECIVLCGASGCGKTSYTRVANGLIPSFFHGAFAGNQTTCGAGCGDRADRPAHPAGRQRVPKPENPVFQRERHRRARLPGRKHRAGRPRTSIVVSRPWLSALALGIAASQHLPPVGRPKARIAVAAATMLGPRGRGIG